MIRDILKVSENNNRQKCLELFTRLPEKHSFHASILLLWQQADRRSLDYQTISKILDFTRTSSNKENRRFPFSSILRIWPRKFFDLDHSFIMSMLDKEDRDQRQKGLLKVICAQLKQKNEKAAIELASHLRNDKYKSELLAEAAVYSSRYKRHKSTTWFLEKSITAYKEKPKGLPIIIRAWGQAKLRNRKRIFLSILELCMQNFEPQLLLLAEAVIESKEQIDRHIYAEFILEKALELNDTKLLQLLIDYVTKYKKLTTLFQKSKKMDHDTKHNMMSKYFFQLAILEQNKKKSSQLMSKSREHQQSIRNEKVKLQLSMNIIQRLINLKKANKAYNMVFDSVDCYRKFMRSRNYNDDDKMIISIDFASFLAHIKEYERAGDIFSEIISEIKDISEQKQQAHMLRSIFKQLIQYSYIKKRLALLHEVLDVLESLSDDHHKGFALNAWGFETGGIINDLGNFPTERSEELLLRTVDIAKPLNDNDFFIDIVDAMSTCKLKEKAYSLYQEALRGKLLTAEQVDRISRSLVRIKKKAQAEKLIKNYLMKQE
ncbi:hypothetical protein [Candidatus Uabimicrobium sp. HlEnr_7]|uniref:hypothetical protein n=1 Tax=Candidatus Uabimicrobium helgolandensis TaxID=3095367 RepID=UPI0035573042